jgi:hypothetical protein
MLYYAIRLKSTQLALTRLNSPQLNLTRPSPVFAPAEEKASSQPDGILESYSSFQFRVLDHLERTR